MDRARLLAEWYRRNRVLAWICLAIAVNQLGFGGIVPAVPIYAATFGVSKAAIGLAIAVYGLARFLINVPAGQLADAAGRRWSMALGGLVTVVGNILCALAPTYPLFLLARFVAGSGASMVLTTGQIMAADVATPENRGRTMAIYQSVFLLAVGIGPLPGGFLAQHAGIRVPFLTYAALGGLVALLAFAAVPETRRARVSAVGEGILRPRFAAQMRALASTPAFLLVGLVALANSFARAGALFNLVPQIAKTQLGLSESQIGVGLSLVSLGGLVVAYPAGVLVDHFGRKSVIVPSTMMGALAMVLFTLAPNFGWFLFSCACWAFAAGVAGSAPPAYAVDVAPPGMNAAAMGAYRMLGDAGYVIGPALIGWSADLFGGSTALYGAGTLLLLSGLAFARFAPETRRRLQPRPSASTPAAD